MKKYEFAACDTVFHQEAGLICRKTAEIDRLKQQLDDANKVIACLSNYYDLNSGFWSATEYQFLRDAREYQVKWIKDE